MCQQLEHSFAGNKSVPFNQRRHEFYEGKKSANPFDLRISRGRAQGGPTCQGAPVIIAVCPYGAARRLYYKGRHFGSEDRQQLNSVPLAERILWSGRTRVKIAFILSDVALLILGRPNVTDLTGNVLSLKYGRSKISRGKILSNFTALIIKRNIHAHHQCLYLYENIM